MVLGKSPRPATGLKPLVIFTLKHHHPFTTVSFKKKEAKVLSPVNTFTHGGEWFIPIKGSRGKNIGTKPTNMEQSLLHF